MLNLILIVLTVLIALVLILAASKPNRFSITRSISIKAPAEKIHPMFNDFHQWHLWSPWENLDPSMKRNFGGENSGIGAKYAWEGNNKVGVGNMEIVESTPNKIVMDLNFIKPMAARNKAEYSLQPQNDGTHVTWTMSGNNPYFVRILCTLFFNQDKMIGGMFEKGLASLKAVAEK